MPTVLAVRGAGFVTCVGARMPTGLTVRGDAGRVALVSCLVGLVVCRCLKRLSVGGCGCGFDVLCGLARAAVGVSLVSCRGWTVDVLVAGFLWRGWEGESVGAGLLCTFSLRLCGETVE